MYFKWQVLHPVRVLTIYVAQSVYLFFVFQFKKLFISTPYPSPHVFSHCHTQRRALTCTRSAWWYNSFPSSLAYYYAVLLAQIVWGRWNRNGGTKGGAWVVLKLVRIFSGANAQQIVSFTHSTPPFTLTLSFTKLQLAQHTHLHPHYLMSHCILAPTLAHTCTYSYIICHLIHFRAQITWMTHQRIPQLMLRVSGPQKSSRPSRRP